MVSGKVYSDPHSYAPHASLPTLIMQLTITNYIFLVPVRNHMNTAKSRTNITSMAGRSWLDQNKSHSQIPGLGMRLVRPLLNHSIAKNLQCYRFMDIMIVI